jgi:hypothetical protein
MKGMIRLALSSYIVVVAGCSRSTAGTPALESGMTPARLSAFGSMAMPASPSARALPGSPVDRPVISEIQVVQLSIAKSAPSETLTVRLHGPGEVRSATTAQFTASVGNGASSSHYYYWWFIASCGQRNGCSPSSYTLLAEGLDHNAIGVRFDGASAEKDLVVQVAEIDGTRRTGSSVEFPVLGPSQRLGGGAEGFAGGVCDWFAGSFYPHTGEYTDPFTGKSWERKFRRDYCGNRISWDPEG